MSRKQNFTRIYDAFVLYEMAWPVELKEQQTYTLAKCKKAATLEIMKVKTYMLER